MSHYREDDYDDYDQANQCQNSENESALHFLLGISGLLSEPCQFLIA